MLKRRIAKLTIMASVAMGGLAALTTGSAVAATGAHAVVASSRMVPADALVSCSYASGERVRQKSWTNGNETRTVYLWYSTTTRCVWGVEANGQPGDEVWVYNENTGAIARAYIQPGQHSATTGEINDAGTMSHACMLPHLANGGTGPKTCTSPF